MTTLIMIQTMSQTIWCNHQQENSLRTLAQITYKVKIANSGLENNKIKIKRTKRRAVAITIL